MAGLHILTQRQLAQSLRKHNILMASNDMFYNAFEICEGQMMLQVIVIYKTID